MSSPSQWYHVSVQSSYCDCPDWGSECKHQYGIRLIVQKHFPQLLCIFPVLDSIHAFNHVVREANAQAREQDAMMGDQDMSSQLPTMAEESVAIIDNQILGCISDLKGLLQSFEEQLGQCDSDLKPILFNQLCNSRDFLSALIVPKRIGLPATGSTRQIQAHVTQTRLGHGVAREADGCGVEAGLV
ncbi:hypothetical protein GOP47_0023342 [Adiantum capillus-veneris]|uniref:SWIM-type domain-containing protein n=1 Tax=Adiantum capillus-veneris TaxID=13818 RepID=A0A9D4U4C3_ADICA|nr:hypothetical protein GOP47_0023342 [Adiantum capillus-veneris]